MSGTLSYVFCLVASDRRPTVHGITAGMPGGSHLRAIDVGERLWAIVEDVPQSDYNEAGLARGLQDLEWVGPRAVAHEHVIERFLRAEALLPMQLFTLFTSDERVVEHVRSDRARIRKILARLAHKVEWGLRLTWDERAARARVEQQHATSATSKVSGSAYLSRKRDLLDVNRMQLAGARKEAGRVYSSVARAAVTAHRRTNMERAAPGSRLLLDAAFLVDRTKVTVFRTAVRKYTNGLRASGVSVALTGPWPAYNFITV